MKTTVKFKNSKGQYIETNVNHCIEIEHECWSISITRDGQDDPAVSDKVKAKVHITLKTQPIKFDYEIFGYNLTGDKHNVRYIKTAWGGFEYKYFIEQTWREAFKEAYMYVINQLDTYDEFVQDREQALQDAEL